MQNFEQFKEHAKRILSIPSNAESGNEELARYFQALLSDFGFKTQLQQVHHSNDSISKRQYNIIGYSSDTLVDRSTRRGTLFANPLDITYGHLSQLWTKTGGNPMAAVMDEEGLIGSGAVQGKLDFLCKIFAGTALIEKRHKQPVYLAGICGSHFGMMGSRFLIESLIVNPKEVFTFGPTNLEQLRSASGQLACSIDLESSNKDRDSRGYNRVVTIQSFGIGLDLASPENAINSFDLLISVILDALDQGFDFQWTGIETKAASGCNPDISKAQIYLTSFQFEDFKQFIKTKIEDQGNERYYRVEYGGITESGTSFIPQDLLEVILELNHLFKPMGAVLSQIRAKSNRKLTVAFEIRFPGTVDATQLEKDLRATMMTIAEKHPQFHLSYLRDYVVPAVKGEGESVSYLTDAGFFDKSKFKTTIMGVGSFHNHPKGPNEFVRWKELEEAIEIYRDMMMTVSL